MSQARHRLRQREPRKRDRRHLAAVARLPSAISGIEPVEVCHVRYGDEDRGKPHTGMGEKPDDKWTVPLTPDEHRLGALAQHKGNERQWWERHGIDPIVLCERLYSCWQLELGEAEVIERMRLVVLRTRSGL